MSEQILLQWKRHPASVEWTIARLPEQRQLEGAGESSFEEMMRRLAFHATCFPAAALQMQRIDRPGLPVHTLDEETSQLLRQDPEQVIRTMQVAVHVPADLPRSPAAPVLAVGRDVLAAAFGDQLHCRVRKEKEVECPGCGRWQPVATDFRCALCALAVSMTFSLNPETSHCWGIVRTQDLLASSHPRFFFPRAWNEGRYWITREALTQKYEQFTEERPS